jgi:hypothetical protein
MKRFAWILLVLAAAGPGCLNLPPANEAPKGKPVAEEMGPPAPPPVEPEQVTEANARQVLEALRAELERARAERPAAAAAPADVPKP